MLGSLKIRHILFFLAIFTIGLTGCKKSDQVKLDPKNPVTIVVWHYYHGAQKTSFDTAVKQFNETTGYEMGIIVEAESFGGVNELAENVLSSAKEELDAKNMPDIFGTYGDTALEILKLDKIVAINEYISDEELAEYEQSFILEGKIGTDNLYVFPIAKSTESLMINKTDFDEFVNGLINSGSNETVSYDDLLTWEGILKVADIYYRYTQSQSPENEGKALFGIDSLANFLIIGSKQLGQDLIKVENGEVVKSLKPEIMSKLWDTYYDGMVMGRLVKSGRFSSDDIKTGDSLCYVGSTSSASYFPTEMLLDDGEAKEIELAVLPMPIFEGGSKIAISQGAGMSVVKSSKEREYASTVFLKWFTDTERNISFSLSSSYLPVKKGALNSELLNATFKALSGNDINRQNSVKALEVGMEQLRSYSLYSSEVFDGSAGFRTNLPNILLEAVQVGREQYQRLLLEGATHEQASSVVKADGIKFFNNWIDSLKAF